MVVTAAKVLVVVMAVVAAAQALKLAEVTDAVCERGIDLLNCTNRVETLDYVLFAMLAVLIGLLAV